MDERGIAENVARAIAAAFDWSSPPDSRKAAVAYLDSIKSGDVRTLASTSLCLVRRDWSSEIRLHGFKMLQHLVRLRWDEFSTKERINFANLVIIELIPEMANPSEEWALKSQAAALAAEVVRREGVNLWQELLPSLVALCHKGPVEAELVAMILRWLPEDVTVHNEDLEGDRRRSLLRGLTESLPEILPLLYNLLEKHFGAAMSEASSQQLDLAKQHATTITAVLNAVNAYAEWAPVIDLAKYGLIHGCGFLLNSVEFRFHACEFFKIVSQRKRVNDTSVAEYDCAMRNVFQILMNISRDFLCKSISGAAGIDEIEFELAECVCESMVSLGSLNLQCIAGDSSLISQYLQQMLGYFQHFKLALHFQALLFWLVLMRDGISKPKVSVQTIGSGPVEKERKGMSMHVSDDICAAMLDVSFQRMLRKNIPSGTTMTVTELELWSDEFVNKCDFSQYRSRLLDLIRLVASHRPVVAAARVSQRIETIIKSCHDASPQALTLLESMQLGLETVVSAVFDGSADLRDDVMVPLQRLLEGLLQQLLSLGWTEPALAEILGHYLDALGPFLRGFPNGLGGVVDKLFQLLTSLPLTIQDQSPIGARHARFQICTSFIRIAKAAERSLLPHMKGIAETMARLQGEGRLLRGEHNLLGEAFLVMASSAGIQQQQEVLAWLLEPLSKQWTQLDWQNAYLSDPMGLTRLCSDTQFMWSIFHTVTFFEKALKRSGIKKTNIYLQPFSVAGDSSQCLHPMSPHLPWMLPPLLKLLRSIHSLWSQPVSQSLPPHLRAAMNMGHVEMASFLGEGAKMPKGQLSFADGSLIDMNREGYAEPNENDIRNWLKGVRESGYNVLGLSTTIGDCFFQCLDSSSVTLALMENIQSMGFRHIRQLVHLTIIPLVKSCPAQLWEEWLEKVLHPLFLHCQQALGFSWAGLLHESKARVPDIFGNLSGMELRVEVMEENLLRDLTREMCHLLSVLASPSLNAGIPSLDQLGNLNRMETSSLKDLDAFSTNSLMGFLVNHKDLVVPALRISIEVFAWTDGESVSRLASFCGAVILLAISTNSVELIKFVAKDLFSAIIQALALESNVMIGSDLVGLCREIFVYLSDRDPAPREVLMSLPFIKREDLLAFEEAISKTSSPKEQKLHMKSLLLLSTGNNLKALAAQKSTNVITNVTVKTRSSTTNPGPSAGEDGEVVGLAAFT